MSAGLPAVAIATLMAAPVVPLFAMAALARALLRLDLRAIARSAALICGVLALAAVAALTLSAEICGLAGC